MDQIEQKYLEIESNLKILREGRDLSSNRKNVLDNIAIESTYLNASKSYYEEKEKQSIQNIQIAQPPVTNEIPKTIKTKRNVLLSSVVGLFLMLFFSFLLEYLNKYKKREQ